MGNAVLGGAVLTGLLAGPLGGSLLLQEGKPKTRIANRIIRGFSVLDILLQVVFASWRLGVFAGQRLAGNSIFTLNPAAEVNELAAFGTEWTKKIVFPLGRFTAGWTLHES